jgi:uncharacterized phage-associated protein
MAPYSVFDVAAYILQKLGSTTAMKLQKLVYYSQAWSLVWDDRPLFRERIEAWANGPVCRELYAEHRGAFQVAAGFSNLGDADVLDQAARETIDAVLGYYGEKPAQWLSDLTHGEAPWKAARGWTPAGQPSSSEITHESMAEYYSGIASSP